jgi:hypothetical protein
MSLVSSSFFAGNYYTFNFLPISYVLFIVFTQFNLNPQSSMTRVKNFTHFYTFQNTILPSDISTNLKRILNTSQKNTSKLMAPFSGMMKLVVINATGTTTYKETER